jgi:hypothetical protein
MSSNGDAPEVEERAPTAAWRLTPELDLQAELDIRKWALAGLNRRAEDES